MKKSLQREAAITVTNAASGSSTLAMWFGDGKVPGVLAESGGASVPRACLTARGAGGSASVIDSGCCAGKQGNPGAAGRGGVRREAFGLRLW